MARKVDHQIGLARGWKTHDGKDIPMCEMLGEVHAAWITVADFVNETIRPTPKSNEDKLNIIKGSMQYSKRQSYEQTPVCNRMTVIAKLASQLDLHM